MAREKPSGTDTALLLQEFNPQQKNNTKDIKRFPLAAASRSWITRLGPVANVGNG
jgi:hypothetical protein